MDLYKSLGLPAEKLKFKDHDKLAFYAKAATDIVFKFPFGWEELNGIHNRTNYDLSRHQEYSGKNLMYLDPITNEKFIPYIIEFSVGADRLFLTLIADAYTEETLENGETRVVLKILPKLAPIKVAVLPLSKKLSEKGPAPSINKAVFCMIFSIKNYWNTVSNIPAYKPPTAITVSN